MHGWLLLAALAASPARGAASRGFPGFPHFTRVQVVADLTPRTVGDAFAGTRFAPAADFKVEVLAAPDPAQLARLDAQTLPAALAMLEHPDLPPWLEAAPTLDATDLELPGALALPEYWRGGAHSTPEALGRLVAQVFEKVPDAETLPVAVVNSYVYFDKPSLGYPFIENGRALILNHVRKIARELGMGLPDRPLILVANNTLLGMQPFYDAPTTAALLAHEVGHAVGLGHLDRRGNLMRPQPGRGGSLNAAQRSRVRRWLEHYRPGR